MTILADLYDVEQRARMQALFSGVWGVASVVGPPVGGFITEQWSWRWVFYINIPFGLAAAAIIGFALREPRRPARPSIDYAGAALLTASMTFLMLALFEAHSARSLLEPWRLAAFAAAVAAALGFVRAERRAREPIVPLGCCAIASSRWRRVRLPGRRGDVRRDLVRSPVRPGRDGDRRRRSRGQPHPADAGLGLVFGDRGRLLLRVGYRPTVHGRPGRHDGRLPAPVTARPRHLPRASSTATSSSSAPGWASRC